MIERNLGNIERVIRAVAGLGLLMWALVQPSLTFTEFFAIGVALMLVFNGIFSRCYVWYVLDLNTARTKECAVP